MLFPLLKKRKKRKFKVDEVRLTVLITLFVILFSCIILKLFYVSIFQRKSRGSVSSRNRRSAMNYERVSILDRNGEIIATDVDTVSLYFNKDLIPGPGKVSVQITEVFSDLDVEHLFKKLNENNGAKHILIKRNLTPKQQLEVKKLGIAGTIFVKDRKRLYPHKNLFSHIVGYTDVDRNGISGLEKQYDKYLKNKENNPLLTTMDIKVQGILRRELIKGMLKYKAKAIVGVISNTKTGELLGAVSIPDFNPNQMRNVQPNRRFNRITFGLYEMGSIFKVFNTALGLEKNIINLSNEYEVAQPIKYGRHIIRDAHFRKKIMNISEILVYSSNIGSAKIASDIGTENQIEFLTKLGLLNKLKMDFPSLASPLYPKNWKDINSMTISYGHGIAVSPLHIVKAISGVTNNGVMHNLKLTNQAPDIQTKILSDNISKEINKLMRQVVTNGTGWRANTLGYSVGGKTGTAEKIIEGQYDEDQTRTSFVAVFPMNDPQYTIFVMLDNPDGSDTGRMNTGGGIAAPITARIIENIAPVLGIEPIIEE